MKPIAILLAVAAVAAQTPTRADQPESQPSRATPAVRAYQAACPAVVNISTRQLVRPRMGLFGDDLFDEIFPGPAPMAVPVQSVGSGFLIHPAGFIVTNAHVVLRAQEIHVTLADKSSHDASLIAADPVHDLAVVRIKPNGKSLFPCLPLGRSDDLMVGETVFAIGNPLALSNTLTTGVVSALDRTLEFRGGLKYPGLIQIDAPINPGNSGGVLLNIRGQLIGVNTAIRADAQNIGFAIPVDTLARELPNLLDTQRLHRAVLGVAVASRHAPAGDEVFVKAVTPNTPAAKELKPGDRIVCINDHPVCQIPDFACEMLDSPPGAPVKLGLLRDGKALACTVTPVLMPKPDGKALARDLLGLSLRPVTAELARSLRLPMATGLMVSGLDVGGPAQTIGLQIKDVLFEVEGLRVRDLDDLGRALEDVTPGKVLRLGVARGNVRAWVTVRAGPTPPKTPASNASGDI